MRTTSRILRRSLRWAAVGGAAALTLPSLASGAWPLQRHGPLDVGGMTAAPGRGVLVAVIDSGVDLDHPALRGALWRNPAERVDGRDEDGNGHVDDVQGLNLREPGTPPRDRGGHGTAVAGIIAGRGRTRGRRGIASAATILPVRVLDDDSRGRSADVAEGVRYATARGARVIVLSLGSRSSTPELDAAIRRAGDRGAIVVAAAGNTGGAPLSPAATTASGVLGVAALDRRGRLAALSARGRRVALAAPGIAIRTLAPGGSTARRSGTSFAAPWVGGAAAVLLAAFPRASAATVRRALLRSARRRTLTPTDVAYGALDVRRAWRTVHRWSNG